MILKYIPMIKKNDRKLIKKKKKMYYINCHQIQFYFHFLKREEHYVFLKVMSFCRNCLILQLHILSNQSITIF